MKDIFTKMWILNVLIFARQWWILKYFIQQQKERWICLEFSELGMIAKLYHTYDLESLAKIVTLFYEEQPADKM
jgi:hypothetical protein